MSAITIYRAGAVRDARRVDATPGAVAVADGRIVAAGAPGEMPREGNIEVVEMPDRLILPAMVNAHAHLGLTTLGPRPFGGDFARWLEMIIGEAPKIDSDVAAAVAQGAAMSRQSGVRYIGDIAGSPLAVTALIESGLAGVSFLEWFGIGKREEEAAESLLRLFRSGSKPFDIDDENVHVGIQPHAPYSTGHAVYRAATKLSQNRAIRLSTHLAETPEEIEFVKDATGPFADMLKRLERWDDSIAGYGKHPVDWMSQELKQGRWLVAHCNYVEDGHIAHLARTHTSVAYCPVASDYFGHRKHRYRDMLKAGVNVCLGTDSIVCQSPESDRTGQLLGILPQMRHLYRRDRTDPVWLLKMATINGMLGLSLAEKLATLAKHTPANLIAVKFDPESPVAPLTQVLENDEPVEVVCTNMP